MDLSDGAPRPDLLPRLGPALRRLADSAWSPAGYDDGGPDPTLVAAARERFVADEIPVPQAGLTVTGGALDGIERLLTAHLSPGDRVAVEDPSWSNLLDLIAALDLVPVPIPVDDDGPTESGLRAALRTGARAVIVTSRAHNPTGAAVSRSRAVALRRILRDADTDDVLVIEDDHAGELAATPPHPLAGATARWAFVRSVSKAYGPDLRLAVLAGDPATVARVQGRMRLGAGWVSTVLQRLVVELWRDKAVAATVRRAAVTYADRRERLREALVARGLTVHGRAGINLWLPVGDETAVVGRLRDHRYAVSPGSLYRIASPPGIRITVSPLTRTDIEPCADAVASAIGAAQGGGGR